MLMAVPSPPLRLRPGLIGLVADWIPARDALAVDPMILLRDE
jgi:hypothetical protein